MVSASASKSCICNHIICCLPAFRPYFQLAPDSDGFLEPAEPVSSVTSTTLDRDILDALETAARTGESAVQRACMLLTASR